MKYLTIHETLDSYDNLKFKNMNIPHISLISELESTDNCVKLCLHDYSKDYFTLEAIDDCIFSFNCPSNNLNYGLGYISYSLNNGETWSEEFNQNTISVLSGTKVLIKGKLDISQNNKFLTSTGKYNIEGNILSLHFKDDFIGRTHVTMSNSNNYSYMFYELFIGDTNIVNAKNLILPLTALPYECYCGMFKGCTSLITTPSLPATTLANGCYFEMFSGCTSLITAPSLPATTLANSCYKYMFEDCTSLIAAPLLPAKTLAESCYSNMFKGCTSLIIASSLPATTLADYCYIYMFEDCTSLIAAPSLPAKTLTVSCYYYMFNGCTSLNSVTMLATNISATDCLNHWLYNVSSSGTFTKATSMTSLPTGANGIPEGWTVQDYVAS